MSTNLFINSIIRGGILKEAWILLNFALALSSLMVNYKEKIDSSCVKVTLYIGTLVVLLSAIVTIVSPSINILIKQ